MGATLLHGTQAPGSGSSHCQHWRREKEQENGGEKITESSRAQCETDETETDMGMQWEEQWLPHPGYDAGRAGAPHHDPHGRRLIIRPSPLL